MSSWRLATGQTMEVEQVPWTSLRPHPRNARMGDTEVIGESVDELGVYRPVIISADSYVLAGNHLYESIGERGGGDVPCVRIPVTHTDPRAVRILLVDNRSADRGRYDEGLLVGLLNEVLETERGLIGTGYTPDDLDDLTSALLRAEHAALNPTLYGGRGGGDVYEPTVKEREQMYEAKGVRYVLLEYSNATYVDVIAALNDYRAKFELESNADALLHMLGLPTTRLTVVP